MENVIYLTCCEYNQNHYYSKIVNWFNNIKLYFDDSYKIKIYNDGRINEASNDFLKSLLTEMNNTHNVEWIELMPKLGRKSVIEFPAYLRSFRYMLEDSIINEYDNVLLIENDVFITQRGFDRLSSYLNTKGMFCGFTHKWKFIETAFMLMNDKNSRLKLYNYFINESTWNNKVIFENILTGLVDFDHVFCGERFEGTQKIFDKRNIYDYISQFNWDLNI